MSQVQKAGPFIWSGLVEANCIGSAYWYKYLSANVNVHTEARGGGGGGGGGLGGMLPQENFFWIWCCETASEGIFGHKKPLLIFALVMAVESGVAGAAWAAPLFP